MDGTTILFVGIRILILPAALLLLIAYFGMRSDAPKSSLKFKGTVLLSLMLVPTFILGWEFVVKIRQHEILPRLSAGDVQSITIGSARIDEPGQVGAMMNAVRKSEWFVSRMPPSVEPVDFRIR